MTSYHYDCPDELWEDWKRTVPRNKTLNDAIDELVAQDLATTDGFEVSEATEEVLDELLGGGADGI